MDRARKEREEALYKVASRGQKFEAWAESEPTKALVAAMEDDANVARVKCTKLSPFTKPHDLADAQAEVMAYELVLTKVQRFIQEGKEARQELEVLDEYPDP